MCTCSHVSYDYIIAMADGRLSDTITYRGGVEAQGELRPGEKIPARNGMVFNVVSTRSA